MNKFAENRGNLPKWRLLLTSAYTGVFPGRTTTTSCSAGNEVFKNLQVFKHKYISHIDRQSNQINWYDSGCLFSPNQQD